MSHRERNIDRYSEAAAFCRCRTCKQFPCECAKPQAKESDRELDDIEDDYYERVDNKWLAFKESKYEV